VALPLGMPGLSHRRQEPSSEAPAQRQLSLMTQRRASGNAPNMAASGIPPCELASPVRRDDARKRLRCASALPRCERASPVEHRPHRRASALPPLNTGPAGARARVPRASALPRLRLGVAERERASPVRASFPGRDRARSRLHPTPHARANFPPASQLPPCEPASPRLNALVRLPLAAAGAHLRGSRAQERERASPVRVGFPRPGRQRRRAGGSGEGREPPSPVRANVPRATALPPFCRGLGGTYGRV